MTIIAIIYFLFLAFHLYLLKKLAHSLETKSEKKDETKPSKKNRYRNRYGIGVLSLNLLLFAFSLILIYPLVEMATNWSIAPRVTELEKQSGEKKILIGDEKKYTDLAYDSNGNLHGVYFDEKKLTFFTERLHSATDKNFDEKNTNSTPTKLEETPTKLEEMPPVFSETSSFTQLPLLKKLADGKTLSLKAIWHRESLNTINKKIEVTQKDQASGAETKVILPNKLEEESLLNYAITDDGFLLSYIPFGKIFNQIFIYGEDLKPKPLLDSKLKGHFYAPYYWDAHQAVFFIAVLQQDPKNKKSGFISKLILKKLTENGQTLLEKPLIASKILQTHVTKVAGSHDGKFFVYHAIDEANILLFTWLEKTNFPFLLQWKDLQKIFSFSLAKVKNPSDNSYQVAVLGVDDKNKQTVIISKLKPNTTSSYKTSAANFYFAVILCFFGISLYATSLLILKSSIKKRNA